eukprot:scaffold19523_cov114-Isochrysis_galbana.AAC.3
MPAPNPLLPLGGGGRAADSATDARGGRGPSCERSTAMTRLLRLSSPLAISEEVWWTVQCISAPLEARSPARRSDIGESVPRASGD